jgi:hypothetical protein
MPAAHQACQGFEGKYFSRLSLDVTRRRYVNFSDNGESENKRVQPA